MDLVNQEQDSLISPVLALSETALLPSTDRTGSWGLTSPKSAAWHFPKMLRLDSGGTDNVWLGLLKRYPLVDPASSELRIVQMANAAVNAVVP